MKAKLTCPVCARREIEGDICPNCETHLSLFRMLAELPVAAKAASPAKLQKQSITTWLPVGLTILLVIAGIGLGAAGNSFLSRQQQPIRQTSTATSNQIPAITQNQPTPKLLVQKTSTPSTKVLKKSCGGFYYAVRRGDSLSLISSRFYGNGNSWKLIAKANPELSGRESFLKIDEKLLVPNQEQNCP